LQPRIGAAIPKKNALRADSGGLVNGFFNNIGQKQTLGVRAGKQASDIFLQYCERVSRLIL
jgi:hypothetical protein